MTTVHKDFDCIAMSCAHLGLTGEAWAVWAGWDDQYICMVNGVWANGNAADGQLCRESASVIERYVLRNDDGSLKRSARADLIRIAGTRGWKVVNALPVKGDGVQAPGFYTLCRIAGAHPYVVHFFNSQDGGFHSGSYCKDEEEARAIMKKRSAANANT